MIDSKVVLKDLQRQVRLLEDDLRDRCVEVETFETTLKETHAAATKDKRTALAYGDWKEEQLTQIAVGWVLGTVFLRFLEDNDLVDRIYLSGPGERLERARDERIVYFRQHPEHSDREYLQHLFRTLGKLPGLQALFSETNNPLWLGEISAEAAAGLLEFWQKKDADANTIRHDFTDPEWQTRFLGDLYQELSEAARKKYALLQTPDFIESFILDRTLTPAIRTFGYETVKMIDPACGSGHFLLGSFQRLFSLWQEHQPSEKLPVLAQHALDAVHGIDINPFAVAIARFRLLLAAMKECEVSKIKDAPHFKIHLATGDSLYHGPPVGEMPTLGATLMTLEASHHHYTVEDPEALVDILYQKYHAVVTNPPYITVGDAAMNRAYRASFKSCHRSYSLSCPFSERIFDLCVDGGFTGQITANSFMKREFGQKLIDNILSQWDLTHIIDTSGAHIPGHGTPTVILFGRNRPPVATAIRALQSLKGEPVTPEDPSRGLVWSSILAQIDKQESESDYIKSSDTDRDVFATHPWILSELARWLMANHSQCLSHFVTSIGRSTVVGEDDAWLLPIDAPQRLHVDNHVAKFAIGEGYRDWTNYELPWAVYPYKKLAGKPVEDDHYLISHYLWPSRTALRRRSVFGKRVSPWYVHLENYTSKLRTPLSITFAFVATHNHFVLDRGGKVFNRSAPVIKLPDGATEEQHLELLGLLNSSTACFWLKQVMTGKHKGDGGKAHASVEGQRFEFDATKLKQFPIPSKNPLQLATLLDDNARKAKDHSPNTILSKDDVTKASLGTAQSQDEATFQHMVALQEELDWQCYQFYGLTEAQDQLAYPIPKEGKGLPSLLPGQRAFEIVMARQLAAGKLETTWFERHGSTPITDLPCDWPTPYRQVVERRIARIESDRNIRLIEQPENKRRWNRESWQDRQTRALQQWLLHRLECYFFEADRMLEGSSDKSVANLPDIRAHFPGGTEPALVSTNQLADAARRDERFQTLATLYRQRDDFDLPALVKELVLDQAVPYLPSQRYKPTGLRKRQSWEHTWALQRQEDRGEIDGNDIPVPPKYKSTDFQKTSYWKLRGKLDVPKERWILYPGTERNTDPSPVIAWAGWNHLQQAQALSTAYLDRKEQLAWQADKLAPMLEGLTQLLPWLKQWHNEVDPEFGIGMGDYFEQFVNEEKTNILGN